MEERCTCGAVLPDAARFCHKCGKPQYEEDFARLAEEEQRLSTPASTVTQPAPRSLPSAISYRNARAVVISLFVAAVMFVGVILIGLVASPLIPVVLCAGGFVAVRIYRRQTAEPLTTAAGARLGWMTGLWMFAVLAILCAASAIYIASPEGWQQAKLLWAQFPQSAKLSTLSQHDMLVQLALNLPFFFFLVTLLPGLGGIIGAKFSGRGRSA